MTEKEGQNGIIICHSESARNLVYVNSEILPRQLAARDDGRNTVKIMEEK